MSWLKRSVGDWSTRKLAERNVTMDTGDTLIEVLIALVVISLTAAALLGAFTTSISASADYKNLANLDSVLKSFVEQATYQLEQQPQPPTISPQFVPCATVNPDGSGSYSTITLTQGIYVADLNAIEYWTGTTWSSDPTTCLSAPPSQELLTATATNTVNQTTESIQFAVSDPAFNPAKPATPQFTSAASDIVSATGTSTFSVTATGQPTPTLSVSASSFPPCGVAPSWVTFSDQGGGNGILQITPPAGAATGSPYCFTLLATNSVGTATQNFALTIAAPPGFTSGNSDTITPGNDPSFTVTVTGAPTATLTATGVPAWANFADNMNDTATLSFPTAPVVGTYPITFSATNSAGTNTQSFTLYVNPNPTAPVFTSAINDTVAPNEAFSFTVTATGTPTPTLSWSGTTPGSTGITFTPQSGSGGSVSGTLTGTPTVPNTTYSITFTATNTAGATPQTFQLIVSPMSTPTITSPTTVKPANEPKNKGFTLTIAGTGFICSGPTPVQVTLKKSNNGSSGGSFVPTTCTGNSLTITGTAPTSGTYNLTVTNPDGGSVTQSGAFISS
jgi:type II secretory pathway pseudopilin PulG